MHSQIVTKSQVKSVKVKSQTHHFVFATTLEWIETFWQKAAGCVSSGLYREVGGSGFVILEEWESEQDCDR